MAYISKETSAQIKKQIKEYFKGSGMSATVRIENHSSAWVSIKSNGKLINEYGEMAYKDFNSLTEEQKEFYSLARERQDVINEKLREIKQAALISEYRDNSNVHEDYFDVSYYVFTTVLN